MEHRQPGASGEQAEYLLTQKGLELKPVVVALTEWGDLSCSRTNPTASLSSFDCGASATTLLTAREWHCDCPNMDYLNADLSLDAFSEFLTRLAKPLQRLHAAMLIFPYHSSSGAHRSGPESIHPPQCQTYGRTICQNVRL
jgi:HxlR-like helix-turn-helix